MKQQIALPTANTGLTYNAQSQVGVSLPENAKYTLTGNTGINAKADYTATASLVDKSNYAWKLTVPTSDDQEITFSIAKATVSAKADNKSMVAGGALPTFTVSYIGIPSGVSAEDIFSIQAIATCNADGKTPGSYDIVVADPILTDAAAENYQVGPSENGTLVVYTPYYPPIIDDSKDETGCKHDGTCPASKFTDVNLNDWTHDGIHYCVKNGLMNGTSASTFEPDMATDRAMLVTVLYRLEGEPEVGECPFNDVSTGQWYTNAITWAAENKIVEGVGNSQYAPEAPLSREQFATILFRYAKYKNYDVRVGESTNILSFTDTDTISEWAKEAMLWAVGVGLINGKENNILDPSGDATRAQMAAILYRFCEKNTK